MINILISLLVFIGTSVAHVCIYRLLKKIGYKTFKTVLIYGLGLIFLVYRNWQTFIDASFFSQNAILNNVLLPYTGIVIYSLLSILTIMFFTSPYTGDTSPTVKILLLIKSLDGMTTQALYDSFSEQELIGNRIEYLIKSGYVQKRGTTFFITPKGQKSISLITNYRSWLKWKSSG